MTSRIFRIGVIGVFCLIAASGVFAGGQAEAEGEEPVTLKILHNWGPQEPKWPAKQAIFEGFMEEYPNVTIEEEVLSDQDIPTRVETAYLGGQEPDLVFQYYLGETLNWVDDGVTVPVTQYMDEWGLRDAFLDAALSQYTRADGEIAAFPFEGYTWPIWYNKAIFDEVGAEIPTEVSEIMPAVQAIRDAGYQPFAVGGSDWTGYRFQQMFMISGLGDEKARQLFSEGGFSEDERAVEMMELFVELRDNGFFIDDVAGQNMAMQNEAFFSGEAAMMHGGSWSYSEIPDDRAQDVVLGGFPLVEWSPYSQPIAWAGFTAKGVHITRNGAQKLDVIQDFVTYLYRPESIGLFVKTGMPSPITSPEYNAEELNPLFVQSLDLSESVAFAQLAETYEPPTVNPAWRDFAADTYIPNDMTAEEILTTIDAFYEQAGR